MKVIKLDSFHIVITLDGKGGGTITSDIRGGREDNPEGYLDNDDLRYDASCDALESLVLAHACAGIDVNSPAYLEGLEVAVETITNKFY